MRAGCSISDSTAPSDSASVNTSVRRDDLERRAPRRPRSVNDTMPPKSRIWRAATSWPGWSGSPGHSTRSTAGWPTSASATARGVGAVAVHAHGQRLHAPQHQVAVERRRARRPTAFCTKPMPSAELVVVGGDEPADDVGVAAEVLGGRVHDDVGAERERLLQVRRGERVVDDHAGRRGAWATLGHRGDVDDAPAPGWSASRPTPARRRRATPRSSAVGVGEVDGRPRPARRRRTPCRSAGTCRRRRRCRARRGRPARSWRSTASSAARPAGEGEPVARALRATRGTPRARRGSGCRCGAYS